MPMLVVKYFSWLLPDRIVFKEVPDVSHNKGSFIFRCFPMASKDDHGVSLTTSSAIYNSAKIILIVKSCLGIAGNQLAELTDRKSVV